LPDENLSHEWIGYLEAERFSGLGRRALRQLIGNDQLHATKIGRTTRIDKHSLKRYMHHHDLSEQLRLFD
jgi:excisionase family DNA binding protein